MSRRIADPATAAPAAGGLPRPGDICLCKIVALEEKRALEFLCQRVGKAVAQIEPGRRAPAVAGERGDRAADVIKAGSSDAYPERGNKGLGFAKA
jgi:hypothetical protein